MRLPLIAVLLATTVATPAVAQSNIEGRVGRLESEMRAVQRKVFPGGAGAMVEPQVTPSQAPASDIGAPSANAVDDLTQRVASLEQQLQTMTGQVEQTQYRIRQLEEQFGAYRRDTDAKLAAGVPPVASVADAGPVVPPAPRPAAGARPATPTPADAAPAPTGGVEKPNTGQPDEDEYTYGYRLWAARQYPAAQAQLKKVVADYPRSRRASYAQNLLGRAYLDEGKPNLAATTFYDNYKKMPDGERAPESLYYLGQALLKLNKPADACKVYDELNDAYGTKIGQGMKDNIARARVSAKCK